MAVPIAARRFGALGTPRRGAVLRPAGRWPPAAGSGRRPRAAGSSLLLHDPPGPPSDPWGPWIRQASQRFDVPEARIREVMRQESGGRPNVTSRAGAMGLMQVMPGTYRELQARYGLGPTPTTRGTASWPGRPTSARCTTSTAIPASLPPTTPAPAALRTISGAAAACLARRGTYVARIAPRIAGISRPAGAARNLRCRRDPLRHPARPPPGDRAVMLALRDQRSPPATRPRGRAGGADGRLPRGVVVAMEPIEDGRPVPAPALAGRAVALADPPSEPPRPAPAPAPAGPPAAGGTAREPSRLLAAALPPPALGPCPPCRRRQAAAAAPSPPPARGRCRRPPLAPPPCRSAQRRSPSLRRWPWRRLPFRLGSGRSAAPRRPPCLGLARSAPTAPARAGAAGRSRRRLGCRWAPSPRRNLARAAAAAARDQVALLGRTAGGGAGAPGAGDAVPRPSSSACRARRRWPPASAWAAAAAASSSRPRAEAAGAPTYFPADRRHGASSS